MPVLVPASTRGRARGLGRRLVAVARRTWADCWLPLCAVALFLATDTKIVLKDRIAAAGSTVDPFIVAEVLVYAVVGVYLLRRGAWRPGPGPRHPIEILVLALLALVVLSALFSVVPLYSAVRAGQTAVLVLLFRAAVATGSLAWLRPFAVLTVAATAGLVVVGAVLPTQKGPLQVDRFNWLATHPVVVGQYTALAASVGLALALGEWSRSRLGGQGPSRRALVLAGLTAVCGLGLVATHTRGSLLAAVGGGAAAVLLLVAPVHRLSLAMVVAWGALIVAASGAAWALSWFSRGEGADSLLTLNSRTDLWSLAVDRTLLESPALGFGVGASRTIFYEETGLGGGHNAAINIFADLGFLGLMVWVPLVIWPAMIVWRARPGSTGQLGSRWRVDRAVWLVAFCVLVLNGATYEGLGSTPTLAFTWMLMLAAAAVLVDSGARAGPLPGARPPTPNPDARESGGNRDVTTATPPTPQGHATLAHSIRRHPWLVVGAGVVLMVLLGSAAYLSTPSAEARGRLGLTFPAPGNVLLPVPTGESSLKRYVAQRALFATSDDAVAAVAASTGLPPSLVRERLTVEAAEPGNGLRFRGRARSAEQAGVLVAAAMQSYRDLTADEVRRRAEILAEGQRQSGLPAVAARTMADLAAFGDGVEFVSSPTPQSTDVRGLPWRALLIGLLAGLALGAVVAWFVEDGRYRRRGSGAAPPV